MRGGEAESRFTHNRLNMSDGEDDRQQQGSNEQRQRQRQREESEMRGGEAESGPTHNDNRPSRSGKMCGFYRPVRMWSPADV